ncbi:mCG145815, partial [Mus musculus]
HWDLYRHLHSIPQQAMPQSSQQETQCRKSTRMSTESRVSMKTFTAYCTMKCHHRISDLGLRILSRTHRGSWCPCSTLTWCSLLKHGGCGSTLGTQ